MIHCINMCVCIATSKAYTVIAFFYNLKLGLLQSLKLQAKPIVSGPSVSYNRELYLTFGSSSQWSIPGYIVFHVWGGTGFLTKLKKYSRTTMACQLGKSQHFFITISLVTISGRAICLVLLMHDGRGPQLYITLCLLPLSTFPIGWWFFPECICPAS